MLKRSQALNWNPEVGGGFPPDLGGDKFKIPEQFHGRKYNCVVLPSVTFTNVLDRDY